MKNRKGLSAAVGVFAFSALSMANGCPPEKPVLCSCTLTQSNGFTITASICCPENSGCNCSFSYDEDGNVNGVKAKCVVDAGPPSSID